MLQVYVKPHLFLHLIVILKYQCFKIIVIHFNEVSDENKGKLHLKIKEICMISTDTKKILIHLDNPYGADILCMPNFKQNKIVCFLDQIQHFLGSSLGFTFFLICYLLPLYCLLSLLTSYTTLLSLLSFFSSCLAQDILSGYFQQDGPSLFYVFSI